MILLHDTGDLRGKDLEWVLTGGRRYPVRFPGVGALHQRLGETQSPLALGRRFRYLVLPEFHLEVRQSPAQCMEWDAVVHLWIQTVWLIISDNHVAGPTQRSEHWVGKAAVEMA